MISSLEITIPSEYQDFIKQTEQDLLGVGGIHEITYKTGEYSLKFGDIIVENN